jgi:hypothetical protein
MNSSDTVWFRFMEIIHNTTGTLSLVKDPNKHGTPHFDRGSWWPTSHHWDSGSISEKPALNFIVFKVTQGQAFFPVPLFSLIRIILPTHHAHSFIARTFVIDSVVSWQLKKGALFVVQTVSASYTGSYGEFSRLASITTSSSTYPVTAEFR